MKRTAGVILTGTFPLALFVAAVCSVPVHAADKKAIKLGDRRELLVDDFLIEKHQDLEFRLQKPVPREIVLKHEAPWEGTGCGYHTIFRDGGIVRMYYIAGELTNKDGTKMASSPFLACYAESKD